MAPATEIPDELKGPRTHRLRAGVFLRIEGFQRVDFAGWRVGCDWGWAVSLKGRPIAARQKLERYMVFASVAAANAWAREHPPLQADACYAPALQIESDKGHTFELARRKVAPRTAGRIVRAWKADRSGYSAPVQQLFDKAKGILAAAKAELATGEEVAGRHRWQPSDR